MDTLPLLPSPADLRARLPEVLLRDRRRLQRRLDGVRKVRDEAARRGVVESIAADIAASQRRVARRRAAVPAISYPPALPVSQRAGDLRTAIRDHQVVIVAGETGSGKTTQLPKVCLELGRGVLGAIGHTQPRRLAARTVAERIAEELGTPLGEVVGYKVRFTDRSGDDTLVKVMTDGILLAELEQDRALRQYDTLIIDEAHERSLNIDFLLGYVKQLLPRRPDLKVIITSATIDPERFARHFDDAPVVEVSGRTYPVEVRYRPLVDLDADGGEREDRDQVSAINDAVDELCAEGPGDILVFLSGEREIRDTADALAERRLRDIEVLPLYARLSAAEQHRVFQPHAGRRIVLATNVAETSLTVPGVRYVIDPGTARISRYSQRTKVQRLPIEPISQASANQRKGRCGRTSEGICIRLYTEDDFASRPEFTDPEILRTNLASVLLQMAALALGEIADFPFLDPPDRRHVTDGLHLLAELGALDPAAKDPGKRLTAVGRRLAQLPVDPRLGRMVLAAAEHGCLREVMAIVAALSIQDPRERPVEVRQAADAQHARFADPDSDFLSYLNLWRHLHEQQATLSSSQFRKRCRAEFLNYLRIREWQDVYAQLRQVVTDLGLRVNREPGTPDDIHRSLLAGLLSHIGLADGEKQEYLGARNLRFAIFPGSVLFKRSPRWVMAAELVETSRLWGRDVARISPEWVEPLAGHLVKRTYSEPHWDPRRGAVMASERVTLYGVPIVTSRRVDFGRIDPPLARELFLRRALVEGDWETEHAFFHDNRRLLADAEDLEHRARRRDIVVDDETLFTFYDRRVGSDVVSARHFDRWWRETRAEQPDLLCLDRATLLSEEAAGVSPQDFPGVWEHGGLRLDLSYRFEPGAPDDGVTAQVPLLVLNQVAAARLDWQVPGFREDLVTALLRSLPKPIRRSLVPVPDHARAFLARATPADGPLLDVLEREVRRSTGVVVTRDSWRLDQVPDHLKVRYRVVDERGETVAEGRDPAALQRRLRPALRAELASAAHGLERTGLRSWTVGALPQTVESERAGHVVRAYPALVDEGDSVAVRLFGTPAEQRRAMWTGTRRLLLLNVSSPVTFLRGRLPTAAKLALDRSPYPKAGALLDDCAAAAVDALLADHGGPAWDEAGFARLLTDVRRDLNDVALEIARQVADILAAAARIAERLAALTSPALEAARADVRAQLAGLVYRGFVSAVGRRRLPDVARYLLAIEQRLDKLPRDPARDRERMLAVQEVQQAYQRVAAAPPPGAAVGPALWRIRWMIEELRVSSFAQTLGTPSPISAKRIERALGDLAA